MRKFTVTTIIGIFLTISVYAKDYSNLIIGKWKDKKDKTTIEFTKNGDMIINMNIFEKANKFNCTYNIKGKKINFACDDEQLKKGVYVIDKYKDGILYMYMQGIGKNKMDKYKKMDSR